MNIPSMPRRSANAFTLVELLTVIAIIAVLMGLLFPAIGIIKEQARKVQAKTDVTNIVAAVKQYYTEYGKYPSVQETVADATTDVIVGDTAVAPVANNSALFNTLRSIPDGLNADHKFNPRRIVFFEGKRATDPASPRAGFSEGGTDAGATGSYFDPWGKQYNVVIDTNYDNVLGLDSVYSDFAADKAPRAGCGAFSLGKDNMLGNNSDRLYKNGTTASDDVVSWQ